MTGRVLGLEALAAEVDALRRNGKRVVTTNGAFDLLHAGHRFLFAECRKAGDVLVVGVNSDASVRALKGPGRPYRPQAARARRAARFADYVFIFDELDPRRWLHTLKPHVHATASTYGVDCPEADVVREVGARLMLVPVDGRLGSSTARIAARRRLRMLAWAWLTAAASPVLLACAALRRPTPRMLVIPDAGLGDAVLVSPLLRALKESKPGTEIDVVGFRAGASVLRRNPHVDDVIEVAGRSRPALVARLWRRRYETVVCLHAGPFYQALGAWACAQRRVIAYTTRPDHPRFPRILSGVPAATMLLHAGGSRRFDHQMQVAEALGARRVDYRLDFAVSAAAGRSAEEWLRQRDLISRRFVVINPSAGDRRKQWPRPYWDALLALLAAQMKCPVVVSTGDPSDAERLARHGAGEVVDGSLLTLEEASAVYSRAACFVSVDTGPLYVAHAARAALVVIVGASPPHENIPPPSESVIHVPPPGSEGAAAAERALTETRPEMVYAAIESLVGSRGRVGRDDYGAAR